jgi:phosphoenolpyruvate carboxykinase (GTP)
VPLVFQAFNWDHGVYLGATMTSETTAAAMGGVGQIRRDPMAMLPFCGYHMGDYFRHWIGLRNVIKLPPQVFHVNWFRKNGNGTFLWPGFGENMRVLKWIVDRCRDRIGADESPLGWVPNPETFDFDGIDGFSRGQFQHAQTISEDDWRKEIVMQEEFFSKLYPHVPQELILQCELLAARL